MNRLKDKVALIMGAGSSAGGLSNGMAAAVLFAREGAKVFCVDLKKELMKETEERVQAEGGECVLFEGSVDDANGVNCAVAECVERFGHIDVLFNNVGVQATGGALDVSEEDFDRLMRINVKGMYLAIRAVLPHMLKQGGGSIVNNASIAGIRFSYPSLAYMASKGAVLAMTTAVGAQHAPQGIRCNAVLPGLIATERINSRLKRQFGEDWEEQVRVRERQVPSGKLGDPWDVANAVLYLASDESKYVNATSIVVDGGMTQSTTGHVGTSWRPVTANNA